MLGMKNHRVMRGRRPFSLERHASKIPSNFFLYAAGASILASLFLQTRRHKHNALFVGEWVPTLVVLGLYSKILRMLGTDYR